MREAFHLFRLDSIPAMSRPSYLAEMRHMLLWGMLAALIDGSFSSIVVNKTFKASPILGAVVWSTPMLAHLLSLVWGVLIRGRPKRRTYWLLALGAAGATASIALTPPDWHPWGGWVFAGQVALSRFFVSGLITLRSSIWKANYPTTHRARIASRIQMLLAMQAIAVTAAVGLLFDHDASLYRWVYPVAAGVGVLALLPLRRWRIRGEPVELRGYAEYQAERGGGAQGRWAQLRQHVRDISEILRQDRAFARYCTAQTFLGSANFLVDPVLNYVLTRELGYSYFVASFLMDQLPSLISILSMALWARYFDAVGVLRFRVVNSAVWLGGVVLAFGAMALLAAGQPLAAGLAVGLLVGARITYGIGRGGGAIAWNLGHLHFAGRHNAELYMSIHVGLTGLRGVVMPFIGALTYKYFGWWSFLLAVGSGGMAVLLFMRLARDESAGRGVSGGPLAGEAEPTELTEKAE